MKTKITKKSKNYLKQNKKAKKKHPYNLPVFVDYFDKKNVSLQLYIHTRLKVKNDFYI